MACKDPRLTWLNDFGYNVVRLPRRGIVPLGVIGQDGTAKNWLGTLDQIWTSEAPVPSPAKPQPVAALNGTKTSDLKLSVGLDILGNALGGMFGATVPSLKFAYKNAKFIQFAFRDVRSVGIDPFKVGHFLAKGDLEDESPFVRRFFSGQQKVSALVVTEVLQAKSIDVTAKKDATTEVAVDVPQIQAALGVKVGVATSNQSGSQITYQGPDFLVFGYKAFGIAIVNGQWEIHGLDAQQGLAFAVNDQPPEPVVERDELVDLAFGPAGS
jgi:hypothetical protein